jgi:regulator of replication initiation timing
MGKKLEHFRIPLPKQTERVFKDKKKYDRKAERKINWAKVYKDGCPDCGEPIPPDIEEGQECCQCGHIFWEE